MIYDNKVTIFDYNTFEVKFHGAIKDNYVLDIDFKIGAISDIECVDILPFNIGFKDIVQLEITGRKEYLVVDTITDNQKLKLLPIIYLLDKENSYGWTSWSLRKLQDVVYDNFNTIVFQPWIRENLPYFNFFDPFDLRGSENQSRPDFENILNYAKECIGEEYFINTEIYTSFLGNVELIMEVKQVPQPVKIKQLTDESFNVISNNIDMKNKLPNFYQDNLAVEDFGIGGADLIWITYITENLEVKSYEFDRFNQSIPYDPALSPIISKGKVEKGTMKALCETYGVPYGGTPDQAQFDLLATKFKTEKRIEKTKLLNENFNHFIEVEIDKESQTFRLQDFTQNDKVNLKINGIIYESIFTGYSETKSSYTLKFGNERVTLTSWLKLNERR